MNNLTKSLVRLSHHFSSLNKLPLLRYAINNNQYSLCSKPKYSFTSSSSVPPTPLSPANIPKQNLNIKHEQVQIGQANVDAFETKGAISILDQLKGTKQTQTGELYALMFTCGQCNTKAIRSFTKNAYHNGIVLIRCEGCKKVHLVADNLGWFQDQPKNIQSYGQGKVKKVVDPIAVVRFLNAAFGSQQANKQVQAQAKQNTNTNNNSNNNKQHTQKQKQKQKH